MPNPFKDDHFLSLLAEQVIPTFQSTTVKDLAHVLTNKNELSKEEADFMQELELQNMEFTFIKENDPTKFTITDKITKKSMSFSVSGKGELWETLHARLLEKQKENPTLKLSDAIEAIYQTDITLTESFQYSKPGYLYDIPSHLNDQYEKLMITAVQTMLEYSIKNPKAPEEESTEYTKKMIEHTKATISEQIRSLPPIPKPAEDAESNPAPLPSSGFAAKFFGGLLFVAAIIITGLAQVIGGGLTMLGGAIASAVAGLGFLGVGVAQDLRRQQTIESQSSTKSDSVNRSEDLDNSLDSSRTMLQTFQENRRAQPSVDATKAKTPPSEPSTTSKTREERLQEEREEGDQDTFQLK